jgi:quinol monooxygenase YgiN
MTVGIIATIKVQAGKESAFEEVFRELAGQVKANEPGCQLYDLFRSKTPATYVVMEQYANPEALAAHGKTAHFLAAGPKLAPLLDGRPAIEMLEKV